MKINTALQHRERVNETLASVYGHQKAAAKKAYAALDPDCRTIILAAEMQSGKSGIAVALSSYQRLSLTDSEIVNQGRLKDTLFVLTMPNTDLLAQAKDDLRSCMNTVVTNLAHFKRDKEKYFVREEPKLIIIDECHYGSNEKAIRYEILFNYIEKQNPECFVVFISATPLSALIAAENEAILRENLKTKLVFHKASEEYLGISKMLRQKQVENLNGKSRNILNNSKARELFLSTILRHEGSGWSLIRVPAGTPMIAKELLVSNGLNEEDIFILGSSLSGVPPQDLVDIEQFKIEHKQSMLFGKHIVAITVAGVRAGINFGTGMKESLVASWDSTLSSVAAIVQANIGRACGYHANKDAVHFTNISGVTAYSEIVAYLEDNCSNKATDDLDGLREKFENICRKYDIKALDAGASINKGSRKSLPKDLENYKIYKTDSYLAVPLKLGIEYDYRSFTLDPDYLDAIELLRRLLSRDLGSLKSSRSLPRNSGFTATWVNGDTYDNPEKATKDGTIQERIAKYTTYLDKGREIDFNTITSVGGGVKLENIRVSLFVFSIYNQSKRNIEKRVMTSNDVHEVSNAFSIELDNSVAVLFKKGLHDPDATARYINNILEQNEKSRINEKSKFKRKYAG